MKNVKNDILCYKCKTHLELGPGSKVSRTEECSSCYASIHCCKMCKFYDPSAYNECRETSANRILEKEKSNFCDFFVLKGSKTSSAEENNILDAANSLFKN